MYRAVITGIGVEIPEASITNDELVASFNAWVDTENARRGAAGEPLLQKSDTDFIALCLGRQGRGTCWCSTASSTPSGWRRAFRARDDSSSR